MVLYNLSAINGSSPSTAIAGISQALPELMPMLLIFEFFVIALAGGFSTKRAIGQTNIPMWLTIAGLTTSTTAIFLLVIPGLINLQTVITSISITLGCFLWFMFTKTPSEES